MTNLGTKSVSSRVPKLRFPGFSDTLTQKRLGDICEYKNGGSYEDRVVADGKYNLITLNSIDIDGRIKNEHKTIDSADWYLEKDDLIMVLSDVAHGYFLGIVDIIPSSNKYVLNQRMGLLRKIDDKVNLQFLRIYINKYQSYFKLHGQGSSQQNLSKGDIQKFVVNTPSLPEQQKITDFLSSVESYVDNIRSQKEFLQLYKKSVMRKAFSQEYRFRDENGKKYPDWEKSKLGKVSIITMGQSPSSSSYNTSNIGLPLIQGNADIKNRLTLPRQWTTEVRKKAYIDDVIMTVRAPVGYIARSAHEACIGRGVCSIRAKEGCLQDYIYQYLLYFENQWIRYEQGSTFTAINTKDVSESEISIPNIQEQQKIANLLTAIDRVIESKQNQIKDTEIWKKGLMQRMFV